MKGSITYLLPEWLTRRKAERVLHWLKLPLEAMALFAALLPAHFLYVLALSTQSSESFGSFLLQMDWRVGSLMVEFLVVASITSVALIWMEPDFKWTWKSFCEGLTPIRQKKFPIICMQIIRASAIALVGILVAAILFLPGAGLLSGPRKLSGEWVFLLVFLYSACQAGATLMLWSLRRLAWKDGQQVKEWWERHIEEIVADRTKSLKKQHGDEKDRLLGQISEIQEDQKLDLVKHSASTREWKDESQRKDNRIRILQIALDYAKKSHTRLERHQLEISRELSQASERLADSLALLWQEKDKSETPTLFAVSHTGYIRLFLPNEIHWIAREKGSPTIHTKTEAFTCDSSIGAIADKIERFGFQKLSSSSIANIRYLSRLSKGDIHRAIMRSGEKLTIPKKRWPKVQRELPIIWL